jgi:hypothetical protein
VIARTHDVGRWSLWVTILNERSRQLFQTFITDQHVNHQPRLVEVQGFQAGTHESAHNTCAAIASHNEAGPQLVSGASVIQQRKFHVIIMLPNSL